MAEKKRKKKKVSHKGKVAEEVKGYTRWVKPRPKKAKKAKKAKPVHAERQTVGTPEELASLRARGYR